MPNGPEGPLHAAWHWLANTHAWASAVGLALFALATVATFFRRLRRFFSPTGAVADKLDAIREDILRGQDQHSRELEGVRDDARGAFVRIGEAEGRVKQLEYAVGAHDDRIRELERVPERLGTLEQRLAEIAGKRDERSGEE